MVIEKCLLNCGIDKLFTVTVDNASPSDVAIGYLRKKFNSRGGLAQNGKYLHMRYMGAVRYVRQSPARLQKFKECVVVEKIECKKMLCLDVCTRWNLTYLMLDAAQNFERAFERFEEQDTNFRAELERGEDPRQKLKYLEFALSEMSSSEKACEMMKKLKESLYEFFDEYKPPLQSTCSQSSVPTHVSLDESQQKMKRQMQALYKKRELEIYGEDKTSELHKYLAEANGEFVEDFDILLWWKVNSPRFPTLSKMARDVLAIPVSTVVSESAFSIGGHVFDQYRSSLTPEIVQALVCTQDWIRKLSSQEDIKKIEEQIQELDKIENDIFIVLT
ncbi:zinc finger BED domain-containing protein RICESLEEPER 2-like [Gossypium hirsutum]|uniref:Zinc finger BED domain-containing protein RICESLEEPER 2-like n=1 Tax=Gossypium hirsutum TaxID=3635 RepID=A0A1U8K060_GOSHI|nr:zinc finger BED domain-containing protein RICESLEEPER 2-like [Gossypium hirsutum]